MIPLSILDLSPIPQGASAADALRNSLDLAQHAEKWGYNRYWLGGDPTKAGDCERGDVDCDRACCGRDEDDSRGIGRHHAAESFAAGDCGTVWDAGVAVS